MNEKTEFWLVIFKLRSFIQMQVSDSTAWAAVSDPSQAQRIVRPSVTGAWWDKYW